MTYLLKFLRRTFIPLIASTLLLASAGCKKEAEPAPPINQGPGPAWEEMPAMAVPRSGGAAITLADGSVMVCGGLALSDNTTFAPSEVYNPTTNTWQPGGGLVSVAAPNLLRLRNGDVVAYGGYANGSSSFVWRYTAATRIWRFVGQLGFMGGRSFVETLSAATELRDGRVVLAASNRVFMLTGNTLQQFNVTNWGDSYYHGTALLGLANGNFLALWDTQPSGASLYQAIEFDPNRTTDRGIWAVPRWYPTASCLSMVAINDSTLLTVGGYGQGRVTLAGNGAMLVNLRTGATQAVPCDVTLNYMPTKLLRLSDGRWVGVSLDDAHLGMSIFDPATRQWKANYGSGAQAGRWPSNEQLFTAQFNYYFGFATVLANDDLFIVGRGVNWRLKKQ